MPFGARRQFLPAEHDRAGANLRAGAEDGVRQDDAVWAERGSWCERRGPDPHQSIVEEVRLDDGGAVDDSSVAELDDVELGDVQRLEPDVAPDLRAHRSQVHRHH